MSTIAGKYVRDENEPILGEGAFGVVYRAMEETTGEVVAIKEMKGRGEVIIQSGVRELVTLNQLRHKNILTLLDVYCDNKQLYLCFEYMFQNLNQYLRLRPHGLSEEKTKFIMKQLLSGLVFAHDRNIAHRDIKPCNILLSSDDMNTKIGDWGCARYVGMSTNRFTSRVCTIWYRAPEIIFGAKPQSLAMDMWGLGCVFAEMLRSNPIFPSIQLPFPKPENDSKQMLVILRSLGFPDEITWPKVTKLPKFFEYRAFYGSNIISERGVDANLFFSDKIPSLSTEGVAILAKMLALCPDNRIKAKDTLKLSYFD